MKKKKNWTNISKMYLLPKVFLWFCFCHTYSTCLIWVNFNSIFKMLILFMKRKDLLSSQTSPMRKYLGVSSKSKRVWKFNSANFRWLCTACNPSSGVTLQSLLFFRCNSVFFLLRVLNCWMDTCFTSYLLRSQDACTADLKKSKQTPPFPLSS